jgi:hypothetical protein
MCIGWDFPSNNDGRIDGLNDSGIHHFTEAPIVSMTREVLQDSLDAKVKYPVIVKFELYQLPIEKFPGIGEFIQIFEKAKNTWSSHPETTNFFQKGIEVLQQSTIPVLAIRDYNTTGLEDVGEKMKGSFASLVKSVGVTFKDATASGSFGIGKHAPFAASSIRTMFYGTYNQQNEIALQGVAKLASYDMGGGNFTQGTGYYGIKKGLEPIRDVGDYFKLFKREEFGTDKFIMGFIGGEGWIDDVVETILLSYLVAIMDGKLEVHISNLIINKQKIASVVDYIMNKKPNSKVRQYYEAYTSNESITVRKEFETYDGMMESIRLSLLMKEGFNRKVSMYRGTGMKIFEKDRFRAPVEFAGVMVVEGNKLNAVLRKMEPPTHDRWTASLYKEDEEYARNLLKQIYDWLNFQARELVKQQFSEKIELHGLEGILPDVTKEEEPLKEIDNLALNECIKSINFKKVSSNQSEIKIKTKRKKKNHQISDKLREKENKPSNNTSKGKSLKKRKSSISNARTFCINDEKGIYRFILTPSGEGELIFQVHISGEDGSKTPIAIKSVKNNKTGDKISFKNNFIGPILVKDKSKLILDVEFEDNERYSLEVSG